MVLFWDLYVAVGDRLMAFYALTKDRGAESLPKCFYYGIDHREHF